MSETTALTAPAAGWYPDRNEANVVRWWDGQQWTDQTQSTAPATAAFEQPVSSAAFGFGTNVTVATAPTAATVPTAATAPTAATIVPGWYPDNHDRSMQRWWDGQQWTTHTAPIVPAYLASGGSLGYRSTQLSTAVNPFATRGMIYSLIGLVLNPFAMMSIGGFVLGIRALRRAPQFAVQNARRGQAIAAIVIGAFGFVVTALLITSGITVAVTQAQLNHVHAFDRTGAQSYLVGQLATGDPNDSASSVSCPPDPVMKPGDTFDCTATLGDGRTLPVHITITDAYSYSWKINTGEATGGAQDDSTPYQADHTGPGQPNTLPDIQQVVELDFATHYGVNARQVDCPADASVVPGASFECVVTLDDSRTARIQIVMSNSGGYSMLVIDPPAGGNVATNPAPSTSDDATNPDLSHT